MWDGIKIAARNIKCLFGQAGESHKKCPRCRGSGLLVSGTRFHQSLAPSNDPCWFCEGVGALPIIGLDGFVLARATSSLQTCSQSLQLHTPLKLGLHHGKFPETRCNVMTFKPHEEVANLVHDFSSAPSWLGPSLERAPFMGEPNGYQDINRGGTKPINTSVGSSKYSSSNQKLQSPSKFPRLFHGSNKRDSQVSPNIPTFSLKNYLQSITMCSMATAEQRSDTGFLSADGLGNGLSGSTLYHEISSQSLVNNAIGQTEVLSQPSVSIMQTEVKNGSRSGLPPFWGLRSDPSLVLSQSYRRSRKKRNRIREKSQKEALERARRIIGTLNFQKDGLSLAEQNGQSDVLNPFIKGRLSEVRSILHEPLTGGGQSISFAVASKDALMRSLASYGQSWVGGLISGGAQDLIQVPTPTRHWPSKS